MKRDHKGIAYRERQEGVVNDRDGKSLDHKVVPNLVKRVCAVEGCGRRIHFVRRTYGPHGRASFWQHTGDGLGQYRSWNLT